MSNIFPHWWRTNYIQGGAQGDETPGPPGRRTCSTALRRLEDRGTVEGPRENGRVEDDRPPRQGSRFMVQDGLGTSAAAFRWAVGIENTFVPHTRAGHRRLDEY